MQLLYMVLYVNGATQKECPMVADEPTDLRTMPQSKVRKAA